MSEPKSSTIIILPQAEGGDRREWRIERLIAHLPKRLQPKIRWLRRPSSRWVRVPAGGLFVAGGCLWFLPVLGLWMLPLGVMLLAEDVPPLRRMTDRCLDWTEHRRPHWFHPRT
jgi:hypothetical protein